MKAPQAISIRNRIIGVLVKRARLKVGMSQRECAEFLGVGATMYRRYEQGQRGLALPQLEALAYLFDVPLLSLLDDAHALPDESPADELPIEQLMTLRRKMLGVQLRQCRTEAGFTQEEVSELLGCSSSTVSQYERGLRDIPLAELELAAEQCARTLSDFLDDQMIPLGEGEQERQALARLDELPPDVREFVLKPTNVLYFRIAMLLSGMKADSLRQIAETLLEITY